jgi:hypothetical protein
MTKLRISPELALPIETVTQAIGIVAKRRVGKSYTARRIAEQLLHAKQQVVMVDPKGDWWGIRSSADGKAPGFPVVILGGEHKDVPLEVSAGEVVAKLVVEERVSALLDLSELRKREIARFMADFLETLYRLKAKEALRTPMMVIIDEADAIAPQKPQEGEERMLGAAEDIVRRGGQRGIGCTMITQRTAVLNKNVLTQCEMLVALRTISPQDLKAMQAWIDVHGSIEERDTLMASLPSLPQGDAWFWSPGWPTADGIFNRVHVLPIETFDSGATPKAGEKRKEPKTVADVDLAALQRQMAATIEKAKADDPRELKKQIAQLAKENRELAARSAKVASAPGTKRALDEESRRSTRVLEQQVARLRKALEAAMKFIVNVSTANFDVAGVDKAELQRAVESALDRATKLIDQRLEARAQQMDRLKKTAESALTALRAVLHDDEVHIDVEVTKNEPFTVGAKALRVERSVPLPRAPRGDRAPAPDGVTPAMQRILNAAAALEQLGISPAKRINVAFFAGYTENGHFNNMVGALRTAALIDYPGNGTIVLTDTGRAAADADAQPITSLADLHNIWLSKVSPSEAKLLRVLVERGPDNPIKRADLAAETGYTENGHFNNMVGHLRTLGAADYPGNAQVVASDVLFPEGLA